MTSNIARSELETQQDVPMELEPPSQEIEQLIKPPNQDTSVQQSPNVLQAETSPTAPVEVVSSNLRMELLQHTDLEAKYKAKLAECKSLRRKVKRLKDRLMKAKKVRF